MIFDKILSPTLQKFPVITRGRAEQIEYQLKWDKSYKRKTIEHNGVFYDVRQMTDEEAEKVWDELHLYNVPI